MNVIGNLEGAVVDAFRDAQTSVTSLGGAFAGAAADQLATRLIHASGLSKSDGLGQTGLRFVVRSVVAAATFNFAARYMPETADNVFFSIVFFAATPGMVQDAVMLGKHGVLAIEELIGGSPRQPAKPPRIPPSPQHPVMQQYMAGKSCNGACDY